MRLLVCLLSISILCAACSNETAVSPIVGDKAGPGSLTQPVSQVFPIQGTFSRTIVSLEEVKFTPSGNASAKEIISVMNMEGDLNGPGQMMQSFINLNHRGNGATRGEMTWNVTWDSPMGLISGEFHGEFTTSFHANTVEDTSVLEGSGGFAGMTLHLHSVGPGNGPFDWDGYIEIAN